ncbi:MAG: hypothetical protein V3V06_04355 [Dehalococcoidia bacterium]
MPTVDVERTKRSDVLRLIRDARFQYPTDEQPDWRTVVNSPELEVGIQIRSGGWIYPDIVVTEEPGHFIQLLAVVALRHEVTETEAMSRWLPLSRAGPLYLYVPAGQAGRANQLCRQLEVHVTGIRTWKRTAAFGLEIVEAYSGPDLLAVVAALAPEFLRPRAYRPQRVRIQEGYRAPEAASLEAAALEPGAQVPALAAGEAPPAVAAPALETPPGVHLPPPSPFPILLGLGMLLTGFGVIFPAELLGAGLAMVAVGVGGWLKEDVLYFDGAGHAEAAPVVQEAPSGIHLPPPSVRPIVLGLGMGLTAFGFVFPGELLGAGITLTILGTIGWLAEDVRDFFRGGQGEHA